MAINLVRNSKVYLCTNVNSAGQITDASNSITSTSLFELQVLDGYSFNQNTETQQITVNEAGNNPVRGSRTFNTALAPVDWSITTYIRPFRDNSRVSAAERVLWNALMASTPISGTTGITVNSLSRTSNASPTATLNISSTSVSVGDVISLNGSNSGDEWNQPVTILSVTSSGTTSNCTVEFAKAPATTAGTSATGVVAYSGAWGWSGTSSGTAGSTFSYVSTMASGKNQLQKFAMLFVVDSVVYAVDNCCVTQASIDFGLDQISQIAWTGQGTKLKQLSTISAGTLSSNATTIVSTASYITNKLSTMTLQSNIGGSGHTTTGATSYTIPITGGNLTINNNVTYLTPTNLGVVNEPVTYYTGTRAISGNVTAYLKTGTNESRDLLNSLLSNSATSSETKYRAVIHMGGLTGSSGTKVDFDMNGTMLQIPTVEIQDVVSTTINFVAQPHDPGFIGGGAQSFDLERNNDLVVRYYNP